MRLPPRLSHLLFALWLLFCPRASQAQINLALRFQHETYLAGEQVVATLTLSNLAGRDITLKGGVTEESWCLVQVNAMRGEPPSYRTDSPVIPPLSIPAGETVSRSIPLHQFFDLNHTGQFRAKISVSYGAARTQFTSPAAFFNVDPGHKIWSTTVGLPEGQPDAGAPRLFSVLFSNGATGCSCTRSWKTRRTALFILLTLWAGCWPPLPRKCKPTGRTTSTSCTPRATIPTSCPRSMWLPVAPARPSTAPKHPNPGVQASRVNPMAD